MVQVSLNALVQKLDPLVHDALEQAAWLCRSMTHYDIEVEHLLSKILEESDSDVLRILRHFDVDTSRLTSDLTAALERLRRGNTRDTPGISRRIPEVLEAAWLHASIEQDTPRIRSGNVLYGLLTNHDLSPIADEISREFRRVDTDTLEENFATLVAESPENRGAPVGGGPAGAAPTPGAPRPAGGGKALDQFTIDLTARAKAGEIDPVLGRDAEIRLMIDILMRRRQNNPILTGEPGVGKTAVVEGFALRIASGEIPPALKNVTIRSLDLGLLQAGAGVRGEFENRLKGVIEEVKSSETPIIVFIDEAHTMIGAGGQEGGSDAANLLKPALARGELRTVAATTWAEYKRYFEKDAALARRFQVVKVEEPTEDVALVMLRGLGATMEKHHGVKVLPEAIDAAVHLTSRYLSDRQLPDKAVSVLDTATARVAVGHSAIPATIEDTQHTIDNLQVEHNLLARETAAGGDHAERMTEIDEALATNRGRLEELNARWEEERSLVEKVLAARAKLESFAEGAEAEAGERERIMSELKSTEEELKSLQGETPLMLPCVDGQAVAEVIGSWTGIPVGRMMADQVHTILNLHDLMQERVVGQDQALQAISRRLQTSRANLGDPNQPIGVFLLVGPSGVGKTETALTLAELMYGGERNLISINMSEFQEAHTVSALKGSPPGYVGYGEGGVLTEAVRRSPYSVVLLDECEKAHPDVMELFYQVFDKGMLEDGTGRIIDFKNTIILLTSNLATEKIVTLCDDEDTMPDVEGLANAIHEDLTSHFKPALVGRMKVVPFYPLRPEVMRMIIGLKVNKIRRRLLEHHGAELVLGDDVVQAVLDRCNEADTGARNVDHILSGTCLPEISRRVLVAMAEGRSVTKVAVGVDGDGAFTYDVT